jgi:SAM-dependent methyltransferase
MHRTLARRRRTARVLLQGVAPEYGLAFTARTGHPGLSSHERPSAALVLEDGRPLPGPANALHEDIRQLGGGRFCFWHDYVYFSSSDDSDPRTNGRRYEVEYAVGPTRAAVLRVREAMRPARPALRAADGVATTGGYDAGILLRSWRRLGHALPADGTIVDFGCGAGERVAQLRAKGLDAFGCDLVFSTDAAPGERTAIEAGVLRPIAAWPYRLPFEDRSCDVVFSVTVLEHVMDYDAALAEIARVLKPGGISVHIFPARWKPIETHVFVPFASVCQSSWWLSLWAWLGVRNQFQATLSARDTAEANSRFLAEETNYLTRRQIRAYARRYFGDCHFAEEATFKPDRYALFQRLGPLRHIWRRWTSETSVRVLVLRQPRHEAGPGPLGTRRHSTAVRLGR